ncbi:MAG: glycoside hydrolase family 3 N-terminal domain-containing protein, partial [Muribaculaceae bacterium]|nr:glycoside hydrolase family 3 N-terminal domain-containing protein [Muribaculaceae bacterium]
MKKLITTAIIALITIITPKAQTLPDSTLKQLAAQMLIIGFQSDSLETDPNLRHYLTEIKPGGIILFDIDLTKKGGLGSRNIKNPQQLAHLTQQIKQTAGYPIIIAADQEGGLVQRLKPQYGYQQIPSAHKIGTEINNPDTTLHYASVMAQQLKQAGINMNLAPELDTHSPQCPVIGKLNRAYSSNTDTIALHASITINQLLKNNIIPVAKHFPGHGSATADSHYGLTDVTQTWTPDELRPFKKLIDANTLPAIMTAHIINKNIDPDNPATLSHKTLTQLLRQTLGYNGTIITDDLYMKGIISNYTIPQAIITTINAGADMIIIGNNINTGFEPDRPQKIINIIVDAVKQGKIPQQRLIDANNHIKQLHRIIQ